MSDVLQLAVRPLSPQRWADLESIFSAKGCSVARGCWCMYYRVSGKGTLTRPSDSQRIGAKRALQDLVDRSVEADAGSSWFGSKLMFDEAGFVEVARRKPARPVVRLQLVSAA